MSAATVAEVGINTGRIIALMAGGMAGGPFALLGGIQAAKFHRNYTSTPEDNKGHVADAVRKQSVVEWLKPQLANMNAKHLEKHLKINNALHEHADDVRQMHREAKGIPLKAAAA
jgi:hypothetical protein